MYLNIGEIEPDIRSRSYAPVLVAALGETLHHVCFVAYESEQAHDLLSARPNPTRLLRSPQPWHGPDVPPKHVGLLCLFENEHELIDAVDFIFDALDERAKRVGDVVDERIADPIGSDGDVVL
jgi:hypothetical protein